MGSGASAVAEDKDSWCPVFPLDVPTVIAIKHQALKCDGSQEDATKLSEFIADALSAHGLLLTRAAAPSYAQSTENYLDSVFIRGFLTTNEADALFRDLRLIGEQKRPKTHVENPKYPLWALYYGLKRARDGALALDRWGSYHESWTRVEEAPSCIERIAEKLRKVMGVPSNEIINSMVVNYYYDGASTYIPAHRDTVNCLQSGSRIYCLSLGSTRSFMLVKNEDCGKYIAEDMTVIREWKVSHGDVFGIGLDTNDRFCHCVPRDEQVEGLRISVIFRSVDKSFVDLSAPKINVKYASGAVKPFTAELITTFGIDDEGVREHIAWLIADREEEKARKGLLKKLHEEDDSDYFMGKGMTVPSTLPELIEAS